MLSRFDPVMLHLAVVGISDFFASAEPVIGGLIPEGIDTETFKRKFEDFLAQCCCIERRLTRGAQRAALCTQASATQRLRWVPRPVIVPSITSPAFSEMPNAEPLP